MKKKLFIAFLALPLVLSACGGGETTTAGERGKNVLTPELQEQLLVKKDEYAGLSLKEGVASKFARSEDQDTVYGNYTTDFFVFHSPQTATAKEKWVIKSKLKEIDVSIERENEWTMTTPFGYQVFNSSFGFKILSYWISFEDAEGKAININKTIDPFGNAIWSNDKSHDELSVNTITGSLVARPSYIGGNDYVLSIQTFDSEKGAYEKVQLYYGENFNGISATPTIESRQIGSIINPTFTYNDVKYTVYTISNGIRVSHEEKGELVSKEYVAPSAGLLKSSLIGHSYVYQMRYTVDKFDGEYTYMDGANSYVSKTVIVDLVDLDERVVDFPYYIEGLEARFFQPDDMAKEKDYQIPQYNIARLQKIDTDKRVLRTNERTTCIVDENLVLHDDIDAIAKVDNYQKVTKLGDNHYYSSYAKAILDKNFMPTLRFVSNETIRPFAKCLVVTENGGAPYAIDENGNYVVPKGQYASIEEIAPGLFRLDALDEKMFFNALTVNKENCTRLKDRTYSNINAKPYFRLLKGAEDTATSTYGKDSLLVFNKTVLEVDYITGITETWSIEVTYNNNKAIYGYVTYTDGDGLLTSVTVKLAMEAAQ